MLFRASAVSTPAVAVVFIGLVCGSGVRAADPAVPPPLVSVVSASNECFSAAVEVTGFLVPRAESIIRLEPDGSHLTAVLVGEGDMVSAGQVMARVARPAFDIPNIPAEAAARPGTGFPAEPIRPGAGAGGEPPARGLSAAAAEAAARPTSASASATPNSPVAAPAAIPIRAPIAGRVIESNASVGTTASLLGEPLFRIAADGEVEVEVEVPGLHVPILAAGQTARVVVEARRELSGHVRLVFVEINPITQLGHARISVDGDSSLIPGKFVRVTIDARRSCGVAVPRAAISYRADGPSVQVVRDDAIETRNVRVGLHSDIDAEIEDGLKAGDVVVANAGTSLRDGDQVKPVFAEKPK
jgi:HlyD family secretion protein